VYHARMSGPNSDIQELAELGQRAIGAITDGGGQAEMQAFFDHAERVPRDEPNDPVRQEALSQVDSLEAEATRILSTLTRSDRIAADELAHFRAGVEDIAIASLRDSLPPPEDIT